MQGDETKKLVLNDRSYSGIIKREIKEYAIKTGIQKTRIAELEVIVSEMLTNVIKYGGEKARFLVTKINEGSKKGIEVICIDSGKGMKNPSKMMQDGVSSSGSLGQGLGAMLRLSDEFDLYSLPTWGTIVMSRIFTQKQPPHVNERIHFSGILLALNPGEKCGDGYKTVIKENIVEVIVTDGLGHGINAYNASAEAIKSFSRYARLRSLEDQIIKIHNEIKQTRGVVCFILSGDLKNNQLRYCGVGNISARILSGDINKNLVSHNGIVGYVLPALLKELSLIWQVNDILVLHSDGISSRWNISNYPGIEKHDPAMLAAAIYKDFGRPQDDASILVLKRGRRKNFYSVN